MNVDANLLMPLALAWAGCKLLNLSFNAACAARQMGRPIFHGGILMHVICLVGGAACILALLTAAWTVGWI